MLCVAFALQLFEFVTVYVIIAGPADTPVTSPVVSFTVAFALLLVHLPPVVVFVSVIFEPMHTALEPDMTATVDKAFTVILFVTLALQLFEFVTVYVIVAEPADTPVTSPVVSSTVAFALLLVHLPPVVVFVSVIFEPTHTAIEPDILATVGKAFTVMLLVTLALQLFEFVTVYVIVAEPVDTPVTSPVVSFTVALALLLVHLPPVVVFVSVIFEPAHAALEPDMLATVGNAFTVTAIDTRALLQVVDVFCAST
jgi:hypothetical protein